MSMSPVSSLCFLIAFSLTKTRTDSYYDIAAKSQENTQGNKFLVKEISISTLKGYIKVNLNIMKMI